MAHCSATPRCGPSRRSLKPMLANTRQLRSNYKTLAQIGITSDASDRQAGNRDADKLQTLR